VTEVNSDENYITINLDDAFFECGISDGICPIGCSDDVDCDECQTDVECDDKDPATTDSCSGKPKECQNIEITECLTGDYYCPDNCDFIADSDCSECESNSDCDDELACTEDICSGDPRRCSHGTQAGCELNDKCVSDGTINNGQYCSDSKFTALKTKDSNCDSGLECLSGECRNTKCYEPGFFQKIITWFSSIFSSVVGLPITRALQESRAVRLLRRKKILPGKPVLLTINETPWGAEMLIEVTQPDGVETEKISGRFFTMYFEGFISHLDYWKRLMHQECNKEGIGITEIIPYYANDKGVESQTVLLGRIG